MPTLYDNIENNLLSEMKRELADATCADVCVGYFNLRGWRHFADVVDRWPGRRVPPARRHDSDA